MKGGVEERREFAQKIHSERPKTQTVTSFLGHLNVHFSDDQEMRNLSCLFLLEKNWGTSLGLLLENEAEKEEEEGQRKRVETRQQVEAKEEKDFL